MPASSLFENELVSIKLVFLFFCFASILRLKSIYKKCRLVGIMKLGVSISVNLDKTTIKLKIIQSSIK